MISKLKGVIDDVLPGLVSVDVNGVCYDVQVSFQTYYHLGKAGDPIELHTHLVVREDAHVLYGFRAKAERAMFLELIKINGVGPKLAIGILSGLELVELANAIYNEDVKTLCKIPGVGKKSGERLVMEMKGRIDKIGLAFTSLPTTSMTEDAGDESTRNDAEQALMALGYKEKDASKSINEVYEPGATVDQLIKDALKRLV